MKMIKNIYCPIYLYIPVNTAYSDFTSMERLYNKVNIKRNFWYVTKQVCAHLVIVWRTHSSSAFLAPIFHFSAAAERRVTEGGLSRDIVHPSVDDATEKGESLLVPASCSISWLRRSSWRVFSSI